MKKFIDLDCGDMFRPALGATDNEYIYAESIFCKIGHGPSICVFGPLKGEYGDYALGHIVKKVKVCHVDVQKELGELDLIIKRSLSQ